MFALKSILVGQYVDDNGEFTEDFENAHQFETHGEAMRYAIHMGLKAPEVEEV